MVTSRATIYDVATLAGVSTATVSRALRDDSRISEATKRQVRSAAGELNYLPRAAARALADQRTNALGLVLPHIDGAYYADLLVGFETIASALGYSVIVTLTNPQQDPRLALRSLAAQVDAVAFGARSEAHDELVAEIAGTRPVATAARPRVGGNDAFFVENRDAARRLTDHLLGNGRRRIAFVGTPEPGSDLGMRHQGYLDSLTAVGLEPTTLPLFPSEEQGRALGHRLLDEGLSHDALVCGNDEIALAVMQELMAGGVRVPEDVAITGWDDTVTARYVTPGLTTVSQPVRRLGGMVAERLARRIAGDDPTEEAVTLPATLAHRTSCGCASSGADGSLASHSPAHDNHQEFPCPPFPAAASSV